MDLLKRLFFILIGLQGLHGASALAQSTAGEPVEIAARLESPVGRIVMDWERAVDVEISTVSTVVVVRFDRPFAGPVQTIAQALEPYVALVRQDRDGQGLRIALKYPVEPRLQTRGRRVVIDLVPPRFEGAVPAVAEAPVLETADLETAEPDRAARYASVRPRPRPAGLTAVTAVEPAADPDPEEPSGPETPEAVSEAEVTLRIGNNADYTRLVFEWPDVIGYRAEPGEASLTLTFDRPGTVDLTPLTVSPPPFVTGAEPTSDDGVLSVRVDHDPHSNTRHYLDGTRVVVDILKPDEDHQDKDQGAKAQDPPADGLPGETSDAVELGQVAEGSETPGAALEPGLSDAPRVPVSFEPRDGGVALVFPWETPPPAAVFRRGDHVWAVFAAQAAFNLSGDERRFRDIVTDMKQIPQSGVSALRIGVRNRMLVTVERSDGAWTIVLGETITAPSAPIVVERILVSDDGAHLAATLPGPIVVSWIKDPETRSHLGVVMSGGEAHGVSRALRLVDLEILASTHGLALEPDADDIELKADDNTVLILRPAGLRLSGMDTRGPVQTGLAQATSPGHMDFINWARGGQAHMTGNLQAFYADVSAMADQAARIPARMDLARFYLANSLEVEALGILAQISTDQPEMEVDPRFRALRGVARFMTKRFEDALTDLSHQTLRFDPAAALWRGAVHAALEQWPAARRDLEEGAPAFKEHGKKAQHFFLMASARAALGVNDLGAAEDALRRARALQIGGRLDLEARLLEGRLAEANGVPEEALGHYQAVIDAKDLPTEVQAVFRKLMLLQALDEIEPPDMIAALERLRFRWRGDDLELSVIEELGRLYVAQGEIRKGLVAMRLAVQSFPATEKARKIADDMAAVFTGLFLDGKADAMTPVQALALFYDFPEQVPIGRKGDEMIRKLADRLVDVDLLEQAAELLDHQIKFRLTGVARAQIATRLAMVHLMDRKPEKALQTIRSTRLARLPERLNRQRRLLESRSLSELGRYDHALEVIEEYEGDDVQGLRADILWRAEDWTATAQAYEALALDRIADDADLDAENRFAIMRAAIAYVLGDDPDGLARLRQRYAGQMGDSPDARAFDIVTRRIETQGIEFRDLARKIAATDTLDAFMASFRDQFDRSIQTGG